LKLATRIIGASLISVVLLTFAAGLLLVHNVQLEFELQQRETARRISRAFSAVLLDSWKTSGTRGVLRFLSDEGPAKTLGLDVRWVQFEENVSPDFPRGCRVNNGHRERLPRQNRSFTQKLTENNSSTRMCHLLSKDKPSELSNSQHHSFRLNDRRSASF